MAGKNSTFVHDRIKAILKTNADGTKQFGVRDQFQKVTDKRGIDDGKRWLAEHIEATEKIREILRKPNWLVSDTETTNVTESAEVIELSFVRPDKSIALDRLIKPVRPITTASQAIHKIRNKDVKDAPSFGSIMPEIIQVLEGIDFVVWYNGSFDIRVLEQTTYENRLPDIPWPEHIDVMPIIATWIGDWNPQQKGFRWAKLEGGHRAAGDCQELIRAMERIASTNTDYTRSLLA